MKQPIFLLLILVLFYSCGIKFNDYYSGIVVDEFGKPLDSVLVKEDLVEEFSIKTVTDSNGFFKMNRTKDVLANIILSKKGYVSDTIRMVWHQHGETTEFSSIITKDSSQLVLRKNNY